MLLTTLSARLQAIDEQLARLRAEKSRLIARASQMQRKRDIRRTIVIGRTILAAVGEGGVPPLHSADELSRWLDARLTRPADRAIFELPVQESVAPGPHVSPTVPLQPTDRGPAGRLSFDPIEVSSDRR